MREAGALSVEAERIKRLKPIGGGEAGLAGPPERASSNGCAFQVGFSVTGGATGGAALCFGGPEGAAREASRELGVAF